MNSLEHYGTPRHSGRYPWGSGKDPYQKNASLLKYAKQLRKEGLSEKEVAQGLGFDSLKKYRAFISIAREDIYQANVLKAQKLKAKGWSNQAIGAALDPPVGEGTVRNLLKPMNETKTKVIENVANELKASMEEGRYVDIGEGMGARLGVNDTRLNSAVELLKQQGYLQYNFKVMQQGTGMYTTIKCLVPPGTPYAEVYANRDKIGPTVGWSDDGGETVQQPREFVQLDGKRVFIRYGDQGGAERDGAIELRRGVEDISLGAASYAQVRIGVDGTHYMKGMALYSSEIPEGYDIVYNTNKESGTPPGDVFKKISKDDPDNPFGATVTQRDYVGSDGKLHQSALNIVGGNDKLNEEGRWEEWSKTLSSQFLAKQPVPFAKKQLKQVYDAQVAEFEEIIQLTNPVVKKQLLESLAEDCDSASVHLKAASLPRQATKVLLPAPGIKSDEVYAPAFNDGEEIALVRYPHAGTFEIPLLRVNNKNPAAKKFLGEISDAVGINHETAARLSGADFDGDTVIAIPTASQKIKSTPALKALEGFDPKQYKVDHETITERQKNLQMGVVSNLITDMTIRGADEAELARAVKHSMVVIDSFKHKLDWKQSAIDNDIESLRKKYQIKEDGKYGGASTLLSLAKSKTRVDTFREQVDPETGKVIRITKENDTYVNAKGQTVHRQVERHRLSLTDDAMTLSSGTPIENAYAEHSNRLKRLAEECRKEAAAVKMTPYSPSAKQAYAPEVASLNNKLQEIEKNKPLERQAQLIAQKTVAAQRKVDPDMSTDKLKKLRANAIATARVRTGASRVKVTFTKKEWDAIQAGAISSTAASKLISKADKSQVRQLAMPKESKGISDAKMAQIKALASSHYTQAEIAEHLGVSTSTVSQVISGKI